jgi:hypothetical protein
VRTSSLRYAPAYAKLGLEKIYIYIFFSVAYPKEYGVPRAKNVHAAEGARCPKEHAAEGATKKYIFLYFFNSPPPTQATPFM